VMVLVAYPLLTVRAAKVSPGQEPVAIFTGADGQVEGVIRQLAPDYQPWATPLLEPPSSEIESLLFALQAVLGAGFIGYYFGVRRERARQRAADGSSSAA